MCFFILVFIPKRIFHNLAKTPYWLFQPSKRLLFTKIKLMEFIIENVYSISIKVGKNGRNRNISTQIQKFRI